MLFRSVEGVVDCYAGFGGSSVKCVLSVDNSSTGSCPSWGAHLAEGIPPLASWEALLFLGSFVPEVESTAFYILRVRGLLLLQGEPWCGLHPLRLGGELGKERSRSGSARLVRSFKLIKIFPSI